MKKLETIISSAEVVKIHQYSGKQGKAKLEKIFGEEVFVIEITERIDSLQAALDYNGKTMERFLWENERNSDQQTATNEIAEIALALREGKELEMNARWYYPWMRKPTAGSVAGFSFSGYAYDDVYSVVGARLCVDTGEKAIYMGNKFTEIYTRHLSPSK